MSNAREQILQTTCALLEKQGYQCIYRSNRTVKTVHAAQCEEKKRCGGNCTLSVRHAPFCADFSLGFSFQFETMSVVNEPV